MSQNTSYIELHSDEISQTVRQYFSWLQEVTGCPVEKEIEEQKTSFKVSLSTFEARRHLTSIYTSLNTGHFAEAYIRCDRLTRRWFSGELTITVNDDTGYETFMEIGRRYTEAAGYIHGFEEFRNVYYPELLDMYKSTGLLDDAADEVNENNVGDVALELETIEQNNSLSKHLRTYTLKGNSALMDFTRPFNVRDVIVCSDSLDYLITASRPTDDDSIHVTMTVKIEPIIDYSYFIFFICQKNNVMIVTDSIEFCNPHVAVSSRNPRRRSEDRENSTGLPYRIIDDILTWRDESKEVTKKDFIKAETYIKKLSEYLTGSARLMIMKIISDMIRNISSGTKDFPQIGTFESMLSSQKLIGTTVDTSSESFDDSFNQYYNKDKAREYYKSWIMPDEGNTTLPAPVITDLQTVEEYRGDVLVTAESARKMADYFVAKREADAKSDTVWNYYEKHKDEERREMERLLSLHKDNILPYVFAGEDVYMVDVRNRSCRDFSSTPINLTVRLSHIFHGTPEDRKNDETVWWHDELFPDICLTETNSWNKYRMFDGMCMNKDAKAIRKGVAFWFHTHAFMTALMGIDRMELPQIYRNYMSEFFVPYVGNSITEDINPLYLVKDPLSRKKENGIRVVFPLCGNCIRRYQKMYKKFEKALVLYDSEEGRITDIVDYDEFRKNEGNG